jgi:putative hydrolases of HD superfamily
LNSIAGVLKFIVEIDKLKAVLRKTKPVGLDRYENSAEHSWHVCLSALMLKEYANDAIDIDRVIRMLLIHDLGEIDAGDTIFYEAETPAVQEKEAAGLRRVLNILPESDATQYITLWEEFEEAKSPDAVFAKAIDRFAPILHNLHGGGHSWKKNGIKKEQVFALKSRIVGGSQDLWDALEEMLNEAVRDGLLK